MLVEQNKDEHRDTVLASRKWDAQVESILDLYVLPSQRQPKLTYRAARRRVSWQYQLNCYGRFFLNAPTWVQALITYRAWREYLVTNVEIDLARNAFTGRDAWLNRGSDLTGRLKELRAAQLAAVRAHFTALLQSVNAEDQLAIKCSVAVVCRSRATGQAEDSEVAFSDVFGRIGLAPVRPIAG